MNQKVGMAESGIATAEIAVARQSRRKKNTTTTARIAPSIMAAMALSYWSFVYLTVLKRGMNFTPGLAASISSIWTRASSNTVTSDAPFARDIAKLTTSLLRTLLIEVRSEKPSRTVATSESFTVRPPPSWICRSPSSNALALLPRTRTD